MCGIAGVYNLNGVVFSSEKLKKMALTISHRGPDGEGYFINDDIALAHKRLAILDLSENAKQPMTSKDGKWTIVYNGFIYNFKTLKKELKKKGCQFISSSDTEVIVEGLALFGISFLKRLNGMFAIGAWNNIQKTIYLSRDRYGIKPLYYWFNGKSLVFASEIKAILSHPDYSIDVNHDALNEYFTFQNLFTYQTLFKGVMVGL